MIRPKMSNKFVEKANFEKILPFRVPKFDLNVGILDFEFGHQIYALKPPKVNFLKKNYF